MLLFFGVGGGDGVDESGRVHSKDRRRSVIIVRMDDKDGAGFGEIPVMPGGRRMAAAWRRLMEALAAKPDAWLELVGEAQQKQMQIAAGLRDNQEAVSPKKGDRRFAAAQWHDNPFFSFLMQNYLLGGDTLLAAIDRADISDEDKKLLRFAAGQYVDAASPANFPMTNPEVIEDAAGSGGQNFAEGMRRFMQDMQDGGISNTDKTAFAVGDNIARTPGAVIFQNDIMQLIEYAPQTAKVFSRPLLMIPPCINKYYILDLQEGNSFVRHAVAAGHRVFMVSWINAGEQQRDCDWDFYLREGVMAALDVVRAVCRQPSANALGFCIGGTMLASALAVLAAEGEKPAHSMTLLAAMLDFSDSGDIGMLMDEEHAESLEAKYGDGGVVDGGELARGFAALRPNDLIWPYFVSGYYRGQKPAAFDLLFWNADSANLPGKMFCEYLRATYVENRIAKGRAVFCGAPVALSSVSIPSYHVACVKDHIVPWRTAFAGAELLGGKKHFALAEGGHIAGIVNPPSAKKGAHRAAASIAACEGATKTPGGWWDNWLQWLSRQGGKKIAAPKKQGGARHPVIEPAPGSYVRAPRPAPSN